MAGWGMAMHNESGVGGIRTPGTFLRYIRFRDGYLQPLRHYSNYWLNKCMEKFLTLIYLNIFLVNFITACNTRGCSSIFLDFGTGIAKTWLL